MWEHKQGPRQAAQEEPLALRKEQAQAEQVQVTQ